MLARTQPRALAASNPAASPSRNAPASEKVVDLEAARKQREFEADLKAKERAAQEATFTGSQQGGNAGEAEEPDVVKPEPSDEWRCPVHDKAGVVKTSDKTGRQFIGCPDCNSFKR